MIDSSYPDFRDYRDRSRLLDGVVAFKERPASATTRAPNGSGR